MAHASRETAARRSRGRLLTALGLTAAVLVVEAAGAIWSRSLALAADAGHMLTDAGGLALALFASWIATRPPTPAKTFGYYRAEILAAVVNALTLLAVAAWILWEAWARVLTPREVLAGPMIAVAALGLLANVVAAWVLHEHAADSLNVRAAYLEVVTDAASSLGVLGAGAVIAVTGWHVADALVSAAIALIIIPRTWRLLRQAVNILLEGTPSHLALVDVEAAMMLVPGVRHVHDLHVWTLTSGREAMSAHVVVDDPGESERLLDELHAVLHSRFGIDHTTIQLDKAPAVVVRLRSPGA
jgi:cobalt-zinc-cadmium efflux system protein